MGPVVDIPGQTGRYQVINGDTRLRIHRDLGHDIIRARVQEMDDLQVVVATVIENRDRQNPPPYDNAIYHSRILNDVYQGDRSALIKDLGYTKGWLSQQLTIATVPTVLVETFPALYQAPSRNLYDLGQTLRESTVDLQSLLDDSSALKAATGQVQVRKLIRRLGAGDATGGAGTRQSSRPDRSFQDNSGSIRVDRKDKAQGRVSLDFSRGAGAFADFLMEKMPELLERYRQETQGS